MNMDRYWQLVGILVLQPLTPEARSIFEKELHDLQYPPPPTDTEKQG
jgi:hypothetical protein